MTARVLRGSAALQGLDVLEVLHAAGADLPLPARSAWLRAVADTQAAGDPLLVLVERDGAPVGAAALEVDRAARVNRVRMLGQGPCDHARLPALDEPAADALADAVIATLERPWQLDLAQLPVDDPVATRLAGRLGGTTTPASACPFAEVDHEVPAVDQLSRNGRKSVRKAHNRLRTDGRELRGQWLAGADLATALPALQLLRQVRDHAVGRASELDTPDGLALHTRLAGLCEGYGVWVDDELAAYILVAFDGDVIRVWDGRIGLEWDRYGLGLLTYVAVLERAQATPDLRAIDWMRGEQQNKMRTTSQVVETTRVRAFSSPTVARWCDLREHAGARALVVARRVVPPSSRAAVRRLISRP